VALDASTWLEQGMSLGEARRRIETNYSSKYGPGTNAPPVPEF
jgi:hypothetical protein